MNDYADVLGSRLTSAIKGGYASADQLQSAFDKVAKSAANSKEELQALVEAVDDVDSAAKKSKGETLMQVAELSDTLQGTMGQAAATVGKGFAGITAGAAAAATATTGLLARLGDGFNQAVNQIGASTGATGKDLKQLGQIAQAVYSHNFGDSLEDVADGISVVRQTTQLMGKELQAATEAGFALRDTFGYDLAESARTASSLMKNFQIDAEKAYNIIAVGAQNGADQNGDLLDTLNEYSAQYAALGLSADQFVNGLISGAKAGVFSIDKVGDAVKEFNIRAKDGSKSTTGAFATLKLNATKTMQAFASGGDTAQWAFFQVVRALESMQDPVAKNQTAVALFGTQYEDLEQTVLPVLASMEDSSKQAYDALGQINQVKYDDLGSAMEGLKRTIEGALLPSASKITSGPLMDAMEALQDMARDGVVIQKVGPALTFALREGLYALSKIEELLAEDGEETSQFLRTLEQAMLEEPKYWQAYYRGTPKAQARERIFGQSDRCRYYLSDARVRRAMDVLIQNLERKEIPYPLLSQFLPLQYKKIRAGQLANRPEALLIDKVGCVIDSYIF